MQQDLTEEQRAIISKVEKLLNMANRQQGNEAEAAAAAAKAQEMLAAYNIDMATIEQGTGTSGKREEQKTSGGMYTYQKDLWRALSELNFCMYFTTKEWYKWPTKTRDWDGTLVKSFRWRQRHQHKIVGRQVNVTLTKTMGAYLEETIERLAMEGVGGANNQRFSNWAVSYRKGAAARIIEKIQDRRNQLEAEEAERIRKAQHAAERAGISTATALTLGDVRQRELDANQDFLHGEGWSARQREKRERWAREAAEAEAAHAAWALANPEEARKEEEKRRKEDAAYWARRSRRGRGYGSAKGDNTNLSAYYKGYDEAEKIGIDPQTSDKRSQAVGRIGRG